MDSNNVSFRKSLITIAVAVLLGVIPTASSVGAQQLPPQEVHRADYAVRSDEVFDVVRQFYDYDSSLPIEARVLESWDDEAGDHESLAFTTSTGERVPAHLSIPPDAETPVPVVVLVHGLGNSRERWWEEDRVALPDGLLAAGVAVFALDLQFHGQRAAANDYQNPVFLTFGNDLHTRSRNMTIQSTIDVRRALDLLRDRPDIDAERIAVMGYSMGGMVALFLSALEPDLAAIVGCAVPMREQRAPTDHFDFAARSAMPILLQIGRDDWLSSPDDAETLQGLIPGDRGEVQFYDAGHQLPPEFATDALEWLVGELR